MSATNCRKPLKCHFFLHYTKCGKHHCSKNLLKEHVDMKTSCFEAGRLAKINLTPNLYLVISFLWA